ncbi:flavodoxin domain-containing protein, partial [Xenorhabdus bovienii]|uniref:flavodoxin domain-containing protein n=1 Tax=Xenorhabdus bovienii TaxID=40576 RepID=UPI0023B23EB8
MTAKPPLTPFLPVSSEELSRLQTAISDFSPHQLAWLSGYFWGMVNHQPQTEITTSAVPVQETVTLLSASQTGNARRLAEQLRDSLKAANLSVNLVNAGDYKFKQISQERVLIIIASTQGEGEPAEEAVALYKYLYSKKAPSMKETVYAVFGLGDTSYENFCQAGK